MRTTRHRLAAAPVAVLLTLLGSIASAQPVAVKFSGTVTSVTDPSGVSGGSIGLGTPVFGRYAIDPAAPGQAGVSSTVYQGSSMDVSAGSLDLAAGLRFVVGNDSGSTGYDFIEIPGLTNTGPPLDAELVFGLYFLDSSGTALDSEDLVLIPNLGAFGDEEDLVIAGGGLDMTASIDSISFVPEPSGGLFWGGLGLLALNRRRNCALSRSRHRLEEHHARGSFNRP